MNSLILCAALMGAPQCECCRVQPVRTVVRATVRVVRARPVRRVVRHIHHHQPVRGFFRTHRPVRRLIGR